MKRLGKINTYNLDDYKKKKNEIKNIKLSHNYKTSLNLKKYYKI